MNPQCSENKVDKTITFCQNGKCCSTGSLPTRLPAKKENCNINTSNNYTADELGECGKFDFELFDSVEGNLTYHDLSDGWVPKYIDIGAVENGIRIRKGYHNIIRCSLEGRIDGNDRNEPTVISFHCEPKKRSFSDCGGKFSFVLCIKIKKKLWTILCTLLERSLKSLIPKFLINKKWTTFFPSVSKEN